MPVGFGPTVGPRQGPDGRDFTGTWSRNTTLTVSYRSDPDAVARLLPPGFEAAADGRVTVQAGGVPSRAALGGGAGSRMYYKYVPRTGSWGEADAAYATCSAPSNYEVKVLDSWEGTGSVTFAPASWEQLPTMSHIVNPLAALPVVESGQARMSRVLLAFNDLSDQRILR